MTDSYPDTLSSTTRQDLSHRHQAMFSPLDVTAFVVALLVIWGPLVAGALRQ